MSPVTAFPANAQGFHDVFGNAWEWTVDFFSALDGFEVHRLYEDFSTPCFDGLHQIIQGSSFVSSGNEASIYSRYHFRPHFLQHASFRLVESEAETALTSDTDAPGPWVGSYPFRQSKAGLERSAAERQTLKDSSHSLLSKHYGSSALFSDKQQNGYDAIFALIAYQYRQLVPQALLQEANVLEVGCGAGGLTSRLAGAACYVMGIDHDAAAVDLAREIHRSRVASFLLPADGILTESVTVQLPPPREGSQVEFRTADPMCLPAELHGFDLVVLNDVLDTVSSPNSILGRLGGSRGLVKSGGMLVVASAFQWSANTTPKSLWLGGYIDNTLGQPVASSLALTSRLQDEFELVQTRRMPLLWNESATDIRGKLLEVAVYQRK